MRHFLASWVCCFSVPISYHTNGAVFRRFAVATFILESLPPDGPNAYRCSASARLRFRRHRYGLGRGLWPRRAFFGGTHRTVFASHAVLQSPSCRRYHCGRRRLVAAICLFRNHDGQSVRMYRVLLRGRGTGRRTIDAYPLCDRPDLRHATRSYRAMERVVPPKSNAAGLLATNCADRPAFCSRFRCADARGRVAVSGGIRCRYSCVELSIYRHRILGFAIDRRR